MTLAGDGTAAPSGRKTPTIEEGFEKSQERRLKHVSDVNFAGWHPDRTVPPVEKILTSTLSLNNFNNPGYEYPANHDNQET